MNLSSEGIIWFSFIGSRLFILLQEFLLQILNLLLQFLIPLLSIIQILLLNGHGSLHFDHIRGLLTFLANVLGCNRHGVFRVKVQDPSLHELLVGFESLQPFSLVSHLFTELSNQGWTTWLRLLLSHGIWQIEQGLRLVLLGKGIRKSRLRLGLLLRNLSWWKDHGLLLLLLLLLIRVRHWMDMIIWSVRGSHLNSFSHGVVIIIILLMRRVMKRIVVVHI